MKQIYHYRAGVSMGKGGREMEKKMSEMTEREILRQQLELLAEASKSATDTELPKLTEALVQVFALFYQCYS